MHAEGAMDPLTFAGIALGLGGVRGGRILEGGAVRASLVSYEILVPAKNIQVFQRRAELKLRQVRRAPDAPANY